MNTLDNDDIRRISSQLDNFYTAYRSYVYYSKIREKSEIESQANQFWKFQEFVLLFSMVVNWCEVFGPLAKNNHWKELTIEDTEYTKLIYEHGDYDYTSWMSYRKYIEDIKNSFIKNVDLYHHQDPNVDLSGIDVSLGVTHEWLNKLASNESSELSSEVFDKWPINNLALIEEIEEDFIAALKPVNV